MAQQRVAVAPAGGLRAALRARMQELEAWVVDETDRLEGLVATLQAENERLRLALAPAAPAAPPRGCSGAAAHRLGEDAAARGEAAREAPERASEGLEGRQDAAARGEAAREAPERASEGLEGRQDARPGAGPAHSRAEGAAPEPEEQGPPLPVGLLFPGWGLHYVTRLPEVAGLPAVGEMLARAGEILDFGVLELCERGHEPKLLQPRYDLPAQFIACLACLEKLQAERADVAARFRGAAGLGVGEYAALCAAGVLAFEDGLRLVQVLGEALQASSTGRKIRAFFVKGLERPALEELCLRATEGHGSPEAGVSVTAQLSPQGFYCAGAEATVLALREMAASRGARVGSSWTAFYSPFLQQEQERLAEELSALAPRLSQPRFAVYMNSASRPVRPDTPPEEILEVMKRHLISPVLWQASLQTMIRDGLSEFYELGPGDLKSLMCEVDPTAGRATTAVWF